MARVAVARAKVGLNFDECRQGLVSSDLLLRVDI